MSKKTQTKQKIEEKEILSADTKKILEILEDIENFTAKMKKKIISEINKTKEN